MTDQNDEESEENDQTQYGGGSDEGDALDQTERRADDVEVDEDGDDEEDGDGEGG